MQAIFRFVRAAVAIIVVGSAATFTQAAPIVFFGIDNLDLSGGGAHPNADSAAASFAAAAGSLATQDFEGFVPGAVPANFAVGSVNASYTSQATSYTQITNGPGGFSTFPVSGKQFIEGLSNQGSTYFTIGFDQSVRAMGFYISDASDWIGNAGPLANLLVNLTQLSGGASLDLFGGLDAATVNNANVAFFGVIDNANPITGFSISSPASLPDADAIGFDRLQVAVAPAPRLDWLVLIGLVSLSAARRMRPQAVRA